MKHKAYDLHFDELRKVFSKHLNQWPNALLTDLAELISDKINKAHEGMIVMSDEDFKKIEKQMMSEGARRERENICEKVLHPMVDDVSIDSGNEVPFIDGYIKAVKKAIKTLSPNNNQHEKE